MCPGPEAECRPPLSAASAQVDKGNKMFIMFYLTKVRNAGKVGKLAAPELKACQYKKR